MTMAEWESTWAGFGVAATIIGGILGGLKLLWELRELRKQRQRDSDLKRIEFFLAQHRRLYEDPDLAAVIKALDGDDKSLADQTHWERNRKFLTFIEEIQLLILSDNMDKGTAFYMFGYFALCARDGKNFREGIDPSPEHWRLFFDFCDAAEKANGKCPA